MYKKFSVEELVDFTKTLKVLYVEDNKEAREAVLALLNNFFETIVVGVDGEDGLEKFHQDSFDLIISDLRMPKMDGIEMSQKIHEEDCTMPIIVTTAHKEADLLIECIKVGITGFILKPINFQQLQRVIKQTCEKIYYKKKVEEYERSLEKLVHLKTQELESAKSRLEDIANRDAMTNLYNRRYFYDIADTLLRISQREEQHFSALMIDIDRFKLINDTYGHLVGDRVIRRLAKIFLKFTRASDIVIRFGGEEFIILLPNTDAEGGCILASKIRTEVEEEEIIADDKDKSIIKFSVSIGVAECDCLHDRSIDSLVHRTDEALYEAKRSGRNRVVLYEKKEI